MIIPVIVCIDEVSIDSCESYQLYIYDSVSAIMEPISSVFHEINTNVLLKNSLNYLVNQIRMDAKYIEIHKDIKDIIDSYMNQ